MIKLVQDFWTINNITLALDVAEKAAPWNQIQNLAGERWAFRRKDMGSLQMAENNWVTGISSLLEVELWNPTYNW